MSTLHRRFPPGYATVMIRPGTVGWLKDAEDCAFRYAATIARLNCAAAIHRQTAQLPTRWANRVDSAGHHEQTSCESKEVGITSINLTRTNVQGTLQGHTCGFAASFKRANGTTGTAETIYFQTDRADTADPTPDFTMADGVDKLPQLPRSGQLNAIAYTLSTDTTFRADWTALIA